MSTRRLTAVLALLAPLAACGQGSPSAAPTEESLLRPFPTQWAATIDNPWLPLVPGTRWTYRATSDNGAERIVVTVLDRTRVVDGVTATVVHDRVTTAGGELVEDTFDWYAQDGDGNVWYLGEDTKAYEDGTVSTEGSWEAGVDGARAGIVMLADPRPGEAYQQEYYEGEAEDRGKVLALDASASGPLGRWTGVLQTEDTTPLEPDLVEHKFYVRGLGVVEEREVAGGDGEHVVLTRTRRPPA